MLNLLVLRDEKCPKVFLKRR